MFCCSWWVPPPPHGTYVKNWRLFSCHLEISFWPLCTRVFIAPRWPWTDALKPFFNLLDLSELEEFHKPYNSEEVMERNCEKTAPPFPMLHLPIRLFRQKNYCKSNMRSRLGLPTGKLEAELRHGNRNSCIEGRVSVLSHWVTLIMMTLCMERERK